MKPAASSYDPIHLTLQIRSVPEPTGIKLRSFDVIIRSRTILKSGMVIKTNISKLSGISYDVVI